MRASTCLVGFAFVNSCLSLQSEQQYTLKKTLDASNFFDSFDFIDSRDVYTHGFARFVSENAATSSGLAKVVNEKIFLGVDNETVIDRWGLFSQGYEGRKTVRLESHDEFDHGLLIVDFERLPGNACGMWPAFWMLRDRFNDIYSEVDLIEGISLGEFNEIALHTSSNPCDMQPLLGTGEILNGHCHQSLEDINGNKQSCGVIAPKGTFGNDFNEKGGGIWALQLESDGIKVWFFERNSIPTSIAKGIINPSQWGSPVLNFGAGNCDVRKAWKQMKIIIDITFCGAYDSGEAWSGYSQCSQKTGYATCEEYVARNPSHFRDVYFLINSIKMFERT